MFIRLDSGLSSLASVPAREFVWNWCAEKCHIRKRQTILNPFIGTQTIILAKTKTNSSFHNGGRCRTLNHQSLTECGKTQILGDILQNVEQCVTQLVGVLVYLTPNSALASLSAYTLCSLYMYVSTFIWDITVSQKGQFMHWNTYPSIFVPLKPNN